MPLFVVRSTWKALPQSSSSWATWPARLAQGAPSLPSSLSKPPLAPQSPFPPTNLACSSDVTSNTLRHSQGRTESLSCLLHVWSALKPDCIVEATPGSQTVSIKPLVQLSDSWVSSWGIRMGLAQERIPIANQIEKSGPVYRLRGPFVSSSLCAAVAPVLWNASPKG